MKHTFTASITHEDDWYIAQGLEVDVASQGESAAAAFAHLGEVFALSFTPPAAIELPHLRSIQVEVDDIWIADLAPSQAQATLISAHA